METRHAILRNAAVPVRDGLLDAVGTEWERLARPGTWLGSAKRLDVVAEARAAAACELCRRRRQALTPAAEDGHHDAATSLGPGMVEAIHRIVTDPGRLTRRWLQNVRDAGVSDEEYVEAVGVVYTRTLVDTLTFALSAEPAALPAPVAGEPSRERPDGAEVQSAWVPTVAGERWTGGLRDVFGDAPPQAVAHIMMALTLVPDEALGLIDSMRQTYRAPQLAISPPQTELIASTVSAFNECFY